MRKISIYCMTVMPDKFNHHHALGRNYSWEELNSGKRIVYPKIVVSYWLDSRGLLTRHEGQLCFYYEKSEVY